MGEMYDKMRQEAIVWEKVANVKRLISQYYELREKMDGIKSAAIKQISEVKEMRVEGLPPLEFPE